MPLLLSTPNALLFSEEERALLQDALQKRGRIAPPPPPPPPPQPKGG